MHFTDGVCAWPVSQPSQSVLGSGKRQAGKCCFRVQGSGFRVQGAECRVQGSGFRVQSSGCRVQGSGCRVQGAGFRVQGNTCRWCTGWVGFKKDRRVVWGLETQLSVNPREAEREHGGTTLSESFWAQNKRGWEVSFDEICWQKIFRLSVRERTESTHFDRNLRGGVKPQSQ